MHIPDGFLDPKICLGTAAVSAAAVGSSLRRVQPERDPALVPRMGLMAAYVFAAQMVNFPVTGGTSGHLLGALLAAVVLGPHAASIVMTAVFLIQAFFFLDGGHTALGANILNMGLTGTFGGYALYRTLAGPAPQQRRCLVAAGVASWCSVMLGASLTSLELAWSGAAAAQRVFPAMLGVHALIGAGEAAITITALGLLWRVRPDLITGRDARGVAGARSAWMAGLGLAVVAALAPLASHLPDGLDSVSQGLRFEARASGHLLPGVFPEYELPLGALKAAPWAPVVVSLIGAGIAITLLRLLFRMGNRPAAANGQPLLTLVDPRVKLLAVLALVFTSILLPTGRPDKLAALLLVAGLGAVLTRVSARWLFGRALLVVPFVGLAALSMFRTPDAPGHGPTAAFYGVAFLRAGISLLATAAFLTATPEPEVLAAFDAFRLPRALSLTVAFALRYLRVLTGEAGRMLQARAVRGGSGGTLALRAQGTGGIVGTLFIRSFERAERVTLSMAARGFRGEMPRADRGAVPPVDRALALVFLVFLMGVWLWR